MAAVEQLAPDVGILAACVALGVGFDRPSIADCARLLWLNRGPLRLEP